jgi:hypothetical protein
MKILHILRSEATPDVEQLTSILSKGQEATRFPLYQDQVDYDRLIELVFDNDKVICWW